MSEISRNLSGSMFNLSTSDTVCHFSSQWTGYTQARDTGTFTDLVLVPQAGEKVRVHNAVLLPLFPFLSHLAGAVGGPQVEVLLPGVELVTVRQMVDLIYTGSCNISSELQVGQVVGLMACLGLVMPREKLEVESREATVLSDINIVTHVDEVMKIEPSDEIEQSQMSSNNNVNLSPGSSSIPEDLKLAESNNNEVLKEKSLKRLFTCPQCPRAFRLNCNLAMHLQIHSSERPVSCPSCPQMFKKTHHLDRHIAWRHLDTFSRDEETEGRSRETESKTSRVVKALNFENNISVKRDKLACPVCGFQAISKVRLALHVRVSHKKLKVGHEDQGTVKKGGKPGRPRKLTFENPPVTLDSSELSQESSLGTEDGGDKEEDKPSLVGTVEETEGYFNEVENSKKKAFVKVGPGSDSSRSDVREEVENSRGSSS